MNEKIELLDGENVWQTKEVLGLPALRMADGPHGLRKQIDSGDHLGIGGSQKATAFPPASLLGCSFDPQIVAKVASAIAKEAKDQQVHIVLGPGVNIKRTPLCGRNFEYFSEDPILSAQMGKAYVKAMEKQGIGCSVKHFCCNNQETYRFTQDSIVDERTMHEIYLRSFQACIEENPATVMVSYNKVNGEYASESTALGKILRKDWGYTGVVVSDWGAVSNRIRSVKAICDLEMPSSHGYRSNIMKEAVKNDPDLEEAIDQSAERIKKLVKKYAKTALDKVDYDNHHQIARFAAQESIVLLKNEGMLPFQKEEETAVIGGFAESLRYQGGGSSHINPYRLEQMNTILSDYSKHISYEKGYDSKSKELDECLVKRALEKAQKVKKILYLMGLPDEYETEGVDRTTLAFPPNQLALLHQLLEVNPNIVVVVLSGSVVDLSFCSQIKGLIMAYLPGQAGSRSILDIVYGMINPSGRLSETFIKDAADCNVKLTRDNHAVYYDESIFVGYRYYHSFQKEVVYPFGYGLSYTTFTYHDPSYQQTDDQAIVSFSITNTGKVSGKEVVQLYIDNPAASVHRARRELKYFQKITLQPNETKKVEFKIKNTDFSFFDQHVHDWVVIKGEYRIVIAKNVNEECFGFLYKIAESDPRFQEHEPISYLDENYNTSDFAKLIPFPLPPKTIKKRRPYSLDSTLEDIKNTIIGRILLIFAKKEANKMIAKEEGWMRLVMEKTLLETPIRSLAIMSGGVLPVETVEGLIDIINFHWITGIKKLRKRKNNG